MAPLLVSLPAVASTKYVPVAGVAALHRDDAWSRPRRPTFVHRHRRPCPPRRLFHLGRRVRPRRPFHLGHRRPPPGRPPAVPPWPVDPEPPPRPAVPPVPALPAAPTTGRPSGAGRATRPDARRAVPPGRRFRRRPRSRAGCSTLAAAAAARPRRGPAATWPPFPPPAPAAPPPEPPTLPPGPAPPQAATTTARQAASETRFPGARRALMPVDVPRTRFLSRNRQAPRRSATNGTVARADDWADHRELPDRCQAR